jgi:hypothetical protein
MNTAELPGVKEWRFADKASWGPGEWQEEPDKRQWNDAITGLVCLAVRHPRMGQWCGYVGVPEGHPFYGKSYEEVDTRLEVHGGITFAGGCQEDKEHGICHIPQPGQPDTVWWFGWDAAHAGDLMPGSAALIRTYEETAEFADAWPKDEYRNLAYVVEECALLAVQLAAMAAGAQEPAPE